MSKILIIDDDPNGREMLRFRLQKAGYEVVEAADGDDGLLKALRRPDLVLMDVRMPKLDGWQLCKSLKTEPRTKHIPIIMLTGCSQPIQEVYGRECGADGYLTKPWDSAQLMQMIRSFLSSTKDAA